MSHNDEGRYAQVNGLSIYYEIHGSGEPLILLPGGFMTIEAMGAIVPALAETRQVIAVELQGHGHTADIDRPLSYEAMADDIAALIGHLGLAQVDLFGYSLGGGVALQTAIRHSEVVRRLALVSTAFKRNGWYPEVLAGMASISVEGFAGTPIHEAYVKTSPNPEAWPTVIEKMRQLLSTDYDWTEGVASLKVPVLILAGDADGDLVGLPSSRLAILPNTTHVGWAPPYHGIITRTGLLPMLTEFLDAPIPVSEPEAK